MYFKNGDTYEGKWLFDKFHGDDGILTQKGNAFKANWNKGAGAGTMTFHIDGAQVDGTMYQADLIFRSERLVSLADGSRYIGETRNN